MNAAAAVAFGAPLISAIGYLVIAFWLAGMGTPTVLVPFALTSVTYTMPASASPSETFVTTPPTFCSWLTGLTVTPAFLKIVVASLPHGTCGAQVTTFRDGLARSATDLIWLGLPASTMISPVLRVNIFGVVDVRLWSVTVVMFVGLAEAKTSAGAPCVICVASDELPL